MMQPRNVAESGNTVADEVTLRRRPKHSIYDLIRGPAPYGHPHPDEVRRS